MTKFFYKAKDWNGKMVKGMLELSSKLEVIESIKTSGLVPLDVSEKNEGAFGEAFKKIFNKTGGKEIASFTRQLSTMMTAGLPLTDALALLKNQTEANPGMQDVLDHLLSSVRSGQPLGRSMEKFSSLFGEAYIASINAGEEGGVLEEVLMKLADNMENENEFKAKVKGAMIYPAIVVGGMVIVAFIMMIFVIPKLLGLYNDFGSEMPAATKILMDMSAFMTKTWFVYPFLAVGFTSVMKIGDRNPEFRMKRDTYKLKIPIMGELTKKTVIANTVRTLSMLLTAGISLVEALKIVSNVADSEVYRRAFVKISERVQKGFSISNSFEETAVFPSIVNQMVSTGEATGKLDEVMMRVADYFSTEAEQSVKSLTSAIEPLIMIVLGIGVCFLVVAVIMPIYNLTSQF